MKRHRTTLILLALFLQLGAAPATQPTPPPIVTRAHQILATLKTSTYQHPTDIDAAAGRYNCDCSGLVSYLLRNELPEHYKAVVYSARLKHPRAIEFAKSFAAASADPKPSDLWQHVQRVADARPGDLWAWHKDPLPETGSTGHIVLFDSTPRQVAPDVYEITVIDSTTKPHRDDTRKPDETGVGRGTMYLQADSQGHPIGYASRSPQGPFLHTPMAIGRPIIPSPSPTTPVHPPDAAPGAP
jgi:hypothetical protein